MLELALLLYVLSINPNIQHSEYISTNKDVTCMATALYNESRGEPLFGTFGVANVILNRVSSNRFPNTVCGVINQKNQFTYNKNNPIYDTDSYNKMLLISLFSMTMYKANEKYTDDNILWYHRTDVDMKWDDSLKVAYIVKNHIFYKE